MNVLGGGGPYQQSDGVFSILSIVIKARNRNNFCPTVKVKAKAKAIAAMCF
jgi:hypothetical protein